MKRRTFAKNITLSTGLAGITFLEACNGNLDTKGQKASKSKEYEISKDLSERMYAHALEITKSKIRGGDSEVFFKKPFIDAAFNKNIFLWDTCLMCCFAKYHLDELPVYQALDNFYGRMEEDGFICREYKQTGEPLWPKDHPVSINPPLLAFAELEIFGVSKDTDRLKKVYPILKNNFQFHVNTYMMDDHLFYGDTMGLGMDNMPREPRGWEPTEGNGWSQHELGLQLAALKKTDEEKLNFFVTEYVNTRNGVWNKQGRQVDFSSQMAMYALQLKEIAELIGREEDIGLYTELHAKIKKALNDLTWNEEDSFYYDLGYNKQINRRHIGMYWALLAKVVPDDRLEGFLGHLLNPDEFYRKTPLPALSASDEDYVGWGDYWLGGVWAPTVYMVLKGLSAYGKEDLARHLAAKVYASVTEVFVATGTFWENYSPDLISYGMPSKKDFCGWTALIPISIYREYIL
ncbi:MGH1-like glycoside hydrolase domain-containing protein [Spongiimicrobium sp. 3-5]|uniref:MGH1-like glycoside hydrolase domain-containing protein n=1 Tax=Spongiimicrobium sp. 3-5 TaxID=3332596 RepID=UPI0039804E99